MPHPLHDQPAHLGPQARPAMGSHHGRTIYQQPSPDEVHAQLDRVTDQLQDRFPQVASLLDEAGPDVLAFSSFPLAHWKKIWSTTHRSVSTRRSGDAPMWWASSLTGRPCAASLAPSWLSSTTNGPLAVDTSHLSRLPSTKLFQKPISRRRQPPKQHQQDDALLHHLTGRDQRMLHFPYAAIYHCRQ